MKPIRPMPVCEFSSGRTEWGRRVTQAMPLPSGVPAETEVRVQAAPPPQKLTNPQVLEAAMVRQNNDAAPVAEKVPVVRMQVEEKKTRVRPSGYRPLYLNYQAAPAYHEPQGMERLLQHRGSVYLISLLIFLILLVTLVAFVMLPP